MVDEAAQARRSDGSDAAAAEAVVRGYWERVWLDRDLDALEDFVAEEVVRHGFEGSETLTRQQLRRRLASAFEAIMVSDLTFDAVTADGATVWLRLTLRGVSLATSAPLTVAWIAQYRTERGRITETWSLHQPGADWSL